MRSVIVSQGDPNNRWRQHNDLIQRSDAQHRVSKDGPVRGSVGAPWSVPLEPAAMSGSSAPAGALGRRSVRGFEVQTGIIKWLNRRRGFVLIGPDSGSADVLLHVTAIEGATPEGLKAGQRVQFETITKPEKPEIASIGLELSPPWPR